MRYSEEASLLKEELQKMNILKDKIVTMLNFLFQNLSEDSVIPQMLAVLAKQITENSVFKENLPKYDKILLDINNIHDEIEECKKNIVIKNNNFNLLKNKLLQPNEENNKVSI